MPHLRFLQVMAHSNSTSIGFKTYSQGVYEYLHELESVLEKFGPGLVLTWQHAGLCPWGRGTYEGYEAEVERVMSKHPGLVLDLSSTIVQQFLCGRGEKVCECQTLTCILHALTLFLPKLNKIEHTHVLHTPSSKINIHICTHTIVLAYILLIKYMYL